MKRFIFIWLFFLCYTIVECLEKEITFTVDAGKEDCFFQSAKLGDVIDVDFQVIDGDHGDLDITFQLIDPTGRILVANYKSSGNTHQVDAKVDGDYKFCFDNTFSSFNFKVVFMELIIENDEDDDEKYEGLEPEEIHDLAVKDIQQILSNVKDHVGKVRHLQELLKTSEARDRNIAEENYFKVNTYSMIQIILMCVVGLIQVIMVRSLFDDNSKAHKIWKTLYSR